MIVGSRAQIYAGSLNRAGGGCQIAAVAPARAGKRNAADAIASLAGHRALKFLRDAPHPPIAQVETHEDIEHANLSGLFDHGGHGQMVKVGYVRHIGLSEVGAATIRRAAATHPIVDLQIEYSLIVRSMEGSILPTCRKLGIGVTAYGVLARGLISGHWTKARENTPDFRRLSPRFAGENLDHNLALVEALRKVAQSRGASVAQIAIACVLPQGPDIVPVIGARRRPQWVESAGALAMTLTPSDLAAIEQAAPKGAAKGERYPAMAMAHLDSEKEE
jgi:pyridoxine 4-dehydrogenase